MRNLLRFQGFRRDAGFSLVEVALAIGIFAVALLSVVGLFPSGLNTLRSSMETTVEGQIVQQVAAAASLTSFANLAKSSQYFDQEGNATGSADSSLRYQVDIDLDDATLPGNNTFSQNDALRLKITIARKAGPNGTVIANSKYTIQVANSGK